MIVFTGVTLVNFKMFFSSWRIISTASVPKPTRNVLVFQPFLSLLVVQFLKLTLPLPLFRLCKLGFVENQLPRNNDLWIHGYFVLACKIVIALYRAAFQIYKPTKVS